MGGDPSPIPPPRPYAEGPGPPTFLITSTLRAELGQGICVPPTGRRGMGERGADNWLGEGLSVGKGLG